VVLALSVRLNQRDEKLSKSENKENGAKTPMQTLTVTHSPLGRKLKQPFTIPVPDAQSPSEQRLQQYIIESLSWKMSTLVPFVLSNSSLQELAKYLLRHRTASTGTLYQYV
jgi:hypothetical protein